VSDMDGERGLSALGANNLPTCIPLEAVACLASSIKQAVACPPSTRFRGYKRNEVDVGATPQPPPRSTCRTWSSQHGVERLGEKGG
jgi:hypothetical protein